MKRTISIGVISLMVFAIIGYQFCCNSTAASSDRWEYCSTGRLYKNSKVPEVDERIEILNRLGKEGWELVVFNMNEYEFIFKRRLP